MAGLFMPGRCRTLPLRAMNAQTAAPATVRVVCGRTFYRFCIAARVYTAGRVGCFIRWYYCRSRGFASSNIADFMLWFDPCLLGSERGANCGVRFANNDMVWHDFDGGVVVWTVPLAGTNMLGLAASPSGW